MSATAAALLQVGGLVLALVLAYRPLGDHLARTLTSERHLAPERLVYRLAGVDPDADQRWPVYLRSVLAFSLVSVLLLFALQRLQGLLPLSLGFPGVRSDIAWNTAVSFVTNTNWQAYSGEQTMGHLVQMAGLTVQNFASAAVGIAVSVTLLRGFARARTDRVGSFFVDLTRISLRVLLPMAVVAALAMVAGGVIQNLHGFTDVTTLTGGTQSIPGGPVASQEAIKELGTNGGGFFNANSAHPFEGPTAWISLLQVFLLLVIPFSLPRTFGKVVGDDRQGYAIAGVMATLWAASTGLLTWAETAHGGTVPQLVGAAMEGKETRFGVPLSALFASSTTLTSTGAVNSFHDSFTPLGGGLTTFNMMLGEIAPGGTGSGLYGMLVLAIITVFVAGLMVGRTPEYLRKKIRPREMKLASLYILTTPAVVLVGTGVAMSMPGQRAGMLNSGPHGFAEVLYAFTSADNNNGSAFAGITVSTVWYDTALGLAMAFGRFLPIVLVVVGLTYFPALALGPLAEGL